MAFSKITLQFTRRVEIGEVINFSYRDLDVNSGIFSFTLNETCALFRLGPGQFEYDQESGVPTDPGNSIISWRDAWNTDHNSTGKWTVLLLSGNRVEIQAKKNNIEFLNQGSNAGVTFTIENEPQVPTFEIVSVENISGAASPCTNTRVRVVCTEPIQDLTSPLQILGVNATSVEFDWPRSQNITVTVNDANTTKSRLHVMPKFLQEPTISVVNSPTGATATASAQTDISGLQYSLDNVNYQNSRSFPGLLQGSYTMYVKDPFGCVKQTGFNVDQFSPDVTTDVPFAYISSQNSIRFKKDELWDNATIFKNDGNCLSYEERGNLLVPFIHKFTDADAPTIQLKTNYETITVTLIDCEGNETNRVALQKTNNLNRVDVRDALGYEFPDGERYGFYFQSGNIYEDDNPTNTIKGTYELFGGLPQWARIGNYISKDFGPYVKIVDIVFVEALNAQVIVVNSSFAGDPVDTILRAQYNVFNWDVYEFDIDMSQFVGNEFQVKVEMTDSDFDPVTFMSEKVQVYSDLSDLPTIFASNTTNNDVVYQTGIKHICRPDIDIDGLSDESELEVHKADDNVYQLDGYSYAKRTMTLTRMSSAVARMMRRILTLDEIMINGIKCTIEAIDPPERIGITNMYKMNFTYFEVEERPTSGDVNTDVDLDVLDIPALITGNNDFIKQ